MSKLEGEFHFVLFNFQLPYGGEMAIWILVVFKTLPGEGQQWLLASCLCLGGLQVADFPFTESH